MKKNTQTSNWLENYNDYNVSAPEGMEGDGYSNVGRNSSPAWGGQFQMGGSIYPVNYIPQAQQGKQIFTKGLEDYINDFLGHPQDDSRILSSSIPGSEAPVDSIRHSLAGAYTQDAIAKRLGNGIIGNVAGVVGSNLMGAAHELGTIFKDKRDWSTKLRESGEDMFNNAAGSVVGAIPYMDSKAKDKMILKMAYGNLLPDGYVATPEGMKQGLSDNIYFKNQKGKIERKYAMGGNMPGAVGNMYARTGSPSKGPRRNQTDVTDASAQNGKEMQYYQNGLDWKPKSISQDGSKLDYHTGDKVTYGTPEYREAYNRGEVITDEGVRSPIQLDEVVIKGKKKDKNWLEQYASKIAEENRDAGLLGAIIGTPISAITSLPQLMGMKALTGEMQRPSEAMDIQNPYGAMAVDAFLDPANAIGVGELTSLGRLTKAQALTKLKNIPASIAPKLKQGLRNNGFLDTFKKKPNFQSEINTMEELPPLPEDFLNKIKKLQESSKSVDMLKQDLADPETIRRAEALGVDPEIFAEASKNMTYSLNRDVPSSYSSSDLEININPNQTGRTPEEAIMSGVMDSHSPNFTANEIGAHELGHFFQDTNYWKNPYPKTISGFDRVMAHAKDLDGKPLSNILDYHSKYSTRNTAPTKVDEMLKDLEIRTGLDKEYYPQKNKNYFVDANKQYGTDVDNMIEKFPMFREYRQGMRDSGILKNKWDEITPEHIEDFRKLKPENRLNSFMEFNDKNYKLLNEVSKIAPAVLPIGLGAASQIEQKREGGIIKDDRGQWDHPGEITEIGSNDITMEGVPYDVLGVSDTGDTKLMKPGKDYKFKGKKVTEYPMAKNGVNQQDQKTFEQLDQLTNFTNYNKPTIGGWLNKYN